MSGGLCEGGVGLRVGVCVKGGRGVGLREWVAVWSSPHA